MSSTRLHARRTVNPKEGMTYESLRADFRWSIPDRLNLGTEICDVHPAGAPGLLAVDAAGEVRTHTFGQLATASNRLGNALRGLGVQRGDRVGVVLPQAAETALTHLACWKIGAVSLPLASLFGPDALAYRLGDSGARVVVTSPANEEKVREAIAQIGEPITVLVTGGTFDDALNAGAPTLRAVDTAAEDPAFIVYTSGTTGPPKGAVHAHRSIFGHLPGFELSFEFFPQRDDMIWTPADWAWLAGLMDALVPSWWFGRPAIIAEHDFDPEWAVRFMVDHQVTCGFLPPTALKMMRAVDVDTTHLDLRAMLTGGEALGEEMLAWCRERIGCTPNEGYGQTEANFIVVNCASVYPVRPGSMGRAAPGHDVRVLDDDGKTVVGQEGEIAVRAPDPVFMLRYHDRPDATAAKIRDGWLLTGDLGVEDEDGYLWFVSRADDVIISAGYRIGPGEIEESLMQHPAVGLCAAIGVPDDVRGEVVKAFVVPKAGVDPTDALANDLRQHVRSRLAAHEVPREIAFVDDLPKTTTGKIMRRELRGG